MHAYLLRLKVAIAKVPGFIGIVMDTCHLGYK